MKKKSAVSRIKSWTKIVETSYSFHDFKWKRMALSCIRNIIEQINIIKNEKIIVAFNDYLESSIEKNDEC